MKLKQVFILMSLIVFSFKFYAMEEQEISLGVGDFPAELKLEILSSMKADNLINLFRNLSKISQTEQEFYALSQDESLIKNLITTHINKQIKDKNLERIISEIIKANDFIQEHLKKGKDPVDKKLLEIIKKIYSPIAQDLSKKYLNLEEKSMVDINYELLKAINQNEINKVKLLLIAGVNPDSIGDFGESILINAVINEKKEIVQALLNAGANPDAQDKAGRTALIVAAQKDNNAIVSLLLNAGANPSIEPNKGTKLTALMWAVMNNNKYITKALLTAGADLDLKNANDQTALQLAEEEGYSREAADIIKKYLSKK